MIIMNMKRCKNDRRRRSILRCKAVKTVAMLVSVLFVMSGCAKENGKIKQTETTTVQDITTKVNQTETTVLTGIVTERVEVIVDVSELVIEAGDKKIYGKLYSPNNADNLKTVVFCHDNNGSLEDWERECNYFAKNGFAAYAFDFCGGSREDRSSGAITEMTITSEKEDLNAVFSFLSGMDVVDKDNIYLCGRGSGGLVCALWAKEAASKVKAMTLYYPAFSMPDEFREKYKAADEIPEVTDYYGTQLSREYVKEAMDLDVFNLIGNYKEDVLIIHGDEDEIVPYSYSEIAEKTYEHCELMKMLNEGHVFSLKAGVNAYEKVFAFFNEEK